MSQQRIVGLVALVVGVVLLIIGLNASDSLADRASDFWTGRFTRSTTWYIVGGAGLGVLGLLLAAFGRRGSKSAL